MKENPIIVPVQLNQSSSDQPYTDTPSCYFKINGAEAKFITELINISYMPFQRRCINMIVNFSNVQNIFIVCGHTDMRCGIV